MSKEEGGVAKRRMDHIVVGPRRGPDGGVPVLGCGRVLQYMRNLVTISLLMASSWPLPWGR
jgi:hypothetical protein